MPRQPSARASPISTACSLQLNEVIHHPSFQKLEATWTRNQVRWSINSETSEMLKIKLLNVSKKDLLRELAAGAGVRSERTLQESV